MGKSRSNGVSLGPCMVMCMLPPTFTSPCTTGLVNISGPHHCLSISLSVQVFHTKARGALMRRVRVMLRSPWIFAAAFMSHLLFAIDHPGDAEAVGAHAEALGPESLLNWHLDGAALGQAGKDALGFGRVVGADIDGKTLRLVIARGRRVRSHQGVCADAHADMHDL